MSKTRLLQSIKSSKRDDVAALLEAYPELKRPPLENAEGKSPLDMVANRRDKTLLELLSKRSPSKRTSAK
jgi:hypothetical protein